MNKLIIFISIVVLVVCLNVGISSFKQTGEERKQESILRDENKRLETELHEKETIKKSKPRLLIEAHEIFINQLKLIQMFTENKVELSLADNKVKGEITSWAATSEYRGISGIDLSVKMQQISSGSQLTIALDLLYQLEKKTDYLIKEIVKENNDLIIRGTLYGIK